MTFKINPSFMRRLLFEIEDKVESLDERILASAKSYAPVSGFIGPFKPTRGGRKRHKARKHAAHMRDTGQTISTTTTGTQVSGGIVFKAPYTWFVERGHKVGGAVKHGGSVKGQYFMWRGLDDHRSEIETASFLSAD